MWQEIADSLKWLFKEYKSHKQHKKDEYREALEALCAALNETLIFLGREGTIRHHANLSRLWQKASIKLHPIDPDLAWRCHIKAGYWTRPEKWSDEDLAEARIELPAIEKEISDFFEGRTKKKAKKKAKRK
ncbi:MAG: hypothetical protein FVQ80_10995 [Planctomycetes bacterium]|nr:hypothetical protein [Planctomycetota bacterium]